MQILLYGTPIYSGSIITPITYFALLFIDCPECNRSIREENLIKHMEDSHSNSKDKKFKCPHENCGFKTNNVNSIPNHIKHMHPSDPTQHPFSCHKCKFCLQKQLLCLHFDQLFVYIFFR